MSPYTEAHFAAALLHCGPHAWHDCKIPGFDCPINARYHDSVYSYFFKLFPEMVTQSTSDTPHGSSHEWTRFWQEYLAWVES